MQYKGFGKTGIKLSALGLGTNRFDVKDINDEEGILNAVSIVHQAINRGINYIDTAHSYSNYTAEVILKKALQNIKGEYHITTKISYEKDKTSDGALHRIENSLKALGISKASFCYVWSVCSYYEYEQIMKKGGIYEGAVKAKSSGLVDHICFSTHAPVEDIIKIINDDVFEGILISYNVQNHKLMAPVLEAAYKKNIGIATMNSLGGGVIPRNEKYFNIIKMNDHETVSQAALKFICSHSEITTALSGMSTWEELDENMSAFENMEDFSAKRIEYVEHNMQQSGGLCTGCNYCSGCPAGIHVNVMMQSYNSTYFDNNTPIYNKDDKEIIKNINIFKTMKYNLNYIPPDSVNPCIKCGECQRKCTQKLPIISRIDEMYNRIYAAGFNINAQKERLSELIKSKKYSVVGFYPSGRYTRAVINLYKELFDAFEFKPYIFDTDKKLWGTTDYNGISVLSPEDIDIIRPDCILISNYNFSQEIYDSIKDYEKKGIRIIKLHDVNDVPWFY